MGPLSLIQAMLEPCESRGQAILTTVCFVGIALGLGASAYACFLYAQAAHATLAEFPVGRHGITGRDRARSGIYNAMALGYGGGGVLGLLSTTSMFCGIVVLIRSAFPVNRDEEQS